jgi:hypothetical protein
LIGTESTARKAKSIVVWLNNRQHEQIVLWGKETSVRHTYEHEVFLKTFFVQTIFFEQKSNGKIRFSPKHEPPSEAPRPKGGASCAPGMVRI